MLCTHFGELIVPFIDLSLQSAPPVVELRGWLVWDLTPLWELASGGFYVTC